MAKTKVQISVDSDLLDMVDQYADRFYTSRSGVFVQGAAQIVNQAIIVDAIQDMALTMRKIADAGQVDENTKKELEDFERLCKMFAGK